MLIAGLTGSIAMGKSTVAKLFKDLGIPMISADEIVHKLYEGPVVSEIEALFPGSTKDGKVDRQALMQNLKQSPDNFSTLEALIHPLVREEEWDFIKEQKSAESDVVIIEIPLLYEIGNEKMMDVVILASADAEIQRSRALERPGMSAEKFDIIMKKQIPDKQKREKADIIINTGQCIEATSKEVKEAVETLKAKSIALPTSANAYQRWVNKMEFGY
jgi:dephospho-CoA kinase